MKKKVVIVIIVLLVLVIFGIIGMMIVNNGNNYSIDDCIKVMSNYEKQMFNNKWIAYSGKQSGANIKTLINTAIANNNENYEFAGKIVRINFVGDRALNVAKENGYNEKDVNSSDFIIGISTFTSEQADNFKKSITILVNAINSREIYTVSMVPDIKTGLISKITIVENGAVESIDDYIKEDKAKDEQKLLEYEKQLQIEMFWKENTGYIIALGISLVILIVVIIITFKKRKKKVEEKE